MDGTVADMAARLGIKIPEPKPVKSVSCRKCGKRGLKYVGPENPRNDSQLEWFLKDATTSEVHSCPRARVATRAYQPSSYTRGRKK